MFSVESLETRLMYAVGLPNVVSSTGRLVFSQPMNTTSSTQYVTLTNTGKARLTFSDISLTGANAAEFAISKKRMPAVLEPGASGSVKVAFAPHSAGVFGGTLQITSNDPDTPVLQVNLRGLGTGGKFDTAEPSLQRVLDTYQIPVNVGDANTATNVIEDSGTSEELGFPLFMKAGTGSVRITPLAAFSWESSPVAEFGWYRPKGTRALNVMFTIPAGNAQTVAPAFSGTTTFDPGTLTFGLYSSWPIESHGPVYSEDQFNTWETTVANRRKVRIYPYRKSSGKLVSTSFVVAMEEAFNSDFQDAVLIIENVKRYDAINAPTNLVATAKSPASVNLTWGDASDNEVSFVIERSGRKSGTYAVVGTVAAGTTVFNDTTVVGGQTYFYHIRAVHRSGYYTLSNRAAATTPSI